MLVFSSKFANFGRFFTKLTAGLLIVAFCGNASGAYRQLRTKEAQIEALKEVVDIIEYQYAGLELAEMWYGFDTDEVFERYKGYIEQALTLDEAKGVVTPEEREILSPEQLRYLLIGVFSELHDGHLSGYKHFGDSSTLGIRSVALEGKLYVAGKNEKYYEPVRDHKELQVGDEVIAIDGEPISKFKNRNLNYISNGTIEARKVEALERILEIPHQLLPPISDKKFAKVTFRRGKEKFTNTYKWTTLDSIRLTRPMHPSEANNRHEAFRSDQPLTFGIKGQVRSHFQEGLEKLATQPGPSGRPQIRLTDIGNEINKARTQELINISLNLAASAANNRLPRPLSSEQFAQHLQSQLMVAPVDRIKIYKVESEKEKPYVVIRIPSYGPDGGIGAVFNEISFIAQAIAYLKESGEADTIVIDQLSNPGGYIAYAHLLLSMFATPEKPLKAMRASYVLSESLIPVYLADRTIDSMLSGAQVDTKQRRALLEELMRQMEDGRRTSSFFPYNLDSDHRLTDEFGQITVKENLPYWDGKLVVLADSRSASCAEIVPAILQDNFRALVLGEKTMGLGNPVVTHISHLNRSELQCRFPYAICQRPNQSFIEKIGVIPDVLREVTIDDLLGGFIKFSADTTNAIHLYMNDQPANVIQLDLNRHHSFPLAMQASGQEMLELTRGVSRMVVEFKNDIEQLVLSVDEDPSPWLDNYKRFFDTLKEEEEADRVPENAWKFVTIPLPDEITDMDPILKTSTRKDVVLRRFEEMLAAGLFDNYPNRKKVVEAIYRMAYDIEGFFHFNMPCDLLFAEAA